ncbi:hypothetical protein EVAR_79452_1 [Eumeta japonica]|uniref:Uncharacterized protein n=1 Tax=Eumeta variegata TaxID=151549 RepID=A0A4C1UF45_EUMVA|nr:hypothetical protein EVAR_79452_1 [Eumeta japonica]
MTPPKGGNSTPEPAGLLVGTGAATPNGKFAKDKFDPVRGSEPCFRSSPYRAEPIGAFMARKLAPPHRPRRRFPQMHGYSKHRYLGGSVGYGLDDTEFDPDHERIDR